MNRVGFILKPSAEAAALFADLVPWLRGRSVEVVSLATDVPRHDGARVVRSAGTRPSMRACRKK